MATAHPTFGTGKRSRPRQPDTPPPPHVFMREIVQNTIVKTELEGIENEAQKATAPASAGGQKGDTDADTSTDQKIRIDAADYEAIIENLYNQIKVYRELNKILDKSKPVTADKCTQTMQVDETTVQVEETLETTVQVEETIETTGKRRKLQWRDNEA